MDRHQRAAVDDLRAAFDRNDDDAVRDALERVTQRDDEPAPPVEPPRPLGRGEAVCRSCRLVVRRVDLGAAALLVCDDCFHA